jgi:hypothetical protein
MRGIGIMGLARSGKDTVGSWLVQKHGYGRVAFADPLKLVAWYADPYVTLNDWPTFARRLSDKVAGPGSWDHAKDEYPEVRRFLQNLGQGIRAVDSEFWIRAALKAAQEVSDAGKPVVFTDVRYPNEAQALRDAGMPLVWIDRPGLTRMTHESENLLGPADADHVIPNDGTIVALRRRVTSVLKL